MAITAPTPMMMPSIVKTERILFRLSALRAILRMTQILIVNSLENHSLAPCRPHPKLKGRVVQGGPEPRYISEVAPSAVLLTPGTWALPSNEAAEGRQSPQTG